MFASFPFDLAVLVNKGYLQKQSLNAFFMFRALFWACVLFGSLFPEAVTNTGVGLNHLLYRES